MGMGLRKAVRGPCQRLASANFMCVLKCGLYYTISPTVAFLTLHQAVTLWLSRLAVPVGLVAPVELVTIQGEAGGLPGTWKECLVDLVACKAG